MSKSVLDKVKEADKKEDVKEDEQVTESNPIVEFSIVHNDPQFVIDGPLKVQIEANKFVSFDDLEPVELVENPSGNLQIGTSGNVIELCDEKLAAKMLENVTHKDDVKTEEKEVTVAEAITSNIPADRVARMIIEQHTVEGSLSKVKEGNSMVKIKVARKIRSMRSTAQKAASVRPMESTKDKSFTLHKAIDVIK